MTAFEDPVSTVMESQVVTLQRSDRLDLAEDIMRLGRVRHLPVLDGERVVGILTSRDLLAASLSKVIDFDVVERRAFARSIEVEEVMTSDVETIAEGATLREAGQAMLRLRIGCLPVVDAGGHFRGLVTETDLLRAAVESGAEPATVGSGRAREGR